MSDQPILGNLESIDEVANDISTPQIDTSTPLPLDTIIADNRIECLRSQKFDFKFTAFSYVQSQIKYLTFVFCANVKILF